MKFAKNDDLLFISPQGYQRAASLYDPQEPAKNLMWTTDYTVELPIKIKKSGPGSEAPLTLIEVF